VGSKGNIISDNRQVLKIWENHITDFYDRFNQPENLLVEAEEEVDADETDAYILRPEVESDVKEMRENRVTGDYDLLCRMSEPLRPAV
jgi:hypothetical protein